MWFDTTPAPDARHARALASDSIKEIKNFVEKHEAAQVNLEPDLCLAANSGRDRVEAARNRVVQYVE